MDDDCDWYDPVCQGKEFLSSTVGDALSSLAEGVQDAVGKVLAAFGTAWVHVGTPVLTGGGASGGRAAGEHASATAGIETVLGYAKWLAFGLCVVALMIAGVRLALSRGDTQGHIERIGRGLFAVIVISAGGGLVLALMTPTSGGSDAVAYLRNSLWWYTIAIGMFGMIVAGIRLAWTERAQPVQDLLEGLLTIAVVTGAGVTVVGLLTSAADSFAVWIIDGAVDCDLSDPTGACFGGNMMKLMVLGGTATAGAGLVLVVIMGLLGVFMTLAQIMLMVVRAGALVALVGVLPFMAAASLSDPQRTKLKKTIGWIIAFIAYKPVAAIIYAAALRMAGAKLWGPSGLVTVSAGLAMMALALFALPALMRLVTPFGSGLSGSGGGAGSLALAGAAALPTGALALSRMGKGEAGSAGPASSGSAGSAGPTGATGNAGAGGSPGPGSGTTGGTGASGAPGATGAAEQAQSAGAGGGATSGAGAGSAAASGAGAGAATSGAVAGGAVAATGGAAAPAIAAAQVAGEVMRTAAATAQGAAESSTETEGGPDGSK